MTCDEYQDFAPFHNCDLKRLMALYPCCAVGRFKEKVIVALALNLDDNKAIVLQECNGLFHKVGEVPSKKPITLDGLYKLIRELNH